MKQSIGFAKYPALLLVVLLACSSLVKAQTVSPTYEYASVIIPHFGIGAKLTASFIFIGPDGTTTNISQKEMPNVSAENGYYKNTNNGMYNISLVINECAQKGWEYVETVAYTIGGNQIIFRREKAK